MKILRKVLLLALVAALAIAGTLFFQKNTPTRSMPESKTIDIQGTINDIGELATAEYSFTITQTAEKPKKSIVGIEIPLTSAKVLYSYEGIIKAGIQFAMVEITQNSQQKTIYVRLPSAEILSTELDNDSLIIYDEEYSIFNTFTFSDMNISLADAKSAANEAAISNGLLERAKENAQVIIRAAIGTLVDLDEYEVVFY